MRLKPEDLLAVAVWELLSVALPSGSFAFHVPNEGKRGWYMQYMARHAGVVSGVPDLVILWQGRAYFLELKAGKNKPTENQELVMGKLFNAGCPCAVAYSVADVETALMNWKIPLRISGVTA